MIRRAVSVVVSLAVLCLVAVAVGGAESAGAAAPGSGYWMLATDGTVSPFGSAGNFGHGPAGSVDLEPTPSGDGYWILSQRGTVIPRGGARDLGGAPALRPGEAAASLSVTPSGRGYWIFTSAGRVFPFGDAAFLGDLGATKLNQPVLDSVATPSGKGYWMVAADGGIFTFGDATFSGSTGNVKLNKPVISMAADPDGAGYWLVASDGGIFAFDAKFFGSMGATKLNKPVSGMVPGSAGYLMVAEDGGIFAFGDVAFHGSLGDKPPVSAIVAVALLPAAAPATTTTTPSTAPPAQGTAAIVVGHVGTYSGAAARPAYAPDWASAADGLSAWAASVNAGGGIGGRPVTLLVGDDRGDAARHLELLESMDAQGAVAFVGNWSAATADPAVRGWLSDRGIPVVGGDLLSDLWDSDPMLFSQGSGLSARIEGLTISAAGRGIKKVAIVRCAETADCAALGDAEGAAAAKAGLTVVYSATVSGAQPDFRVECNSARSAGVEAIFAPGGRVATPWMRFLSSCAGVGYQPLLLVPATDIGPAPGPGVLVASPTLPWVSHGPAMTAAEAALHAAAPDLIASSQSAQAWAAAELFQRTATAAPSVDRAGVLTALRGMRDETVGGLTPPLTFVPGQRSPARCWFLVESKASGWVSAGDSPTCPA